MSADPETPQKVDNLIQKYHGLAQIFFKEVKHGC